MEGKEVGPLRQAAGIAKAADWKLGERWGSPELQEVLMTTTEKVTGWVDPRAVVLPDGLCQRKLPVTPSGIEPATFWLVAQCLSQLRHRVQLCVSTLLKIEDCQGGHFTYIQVNILLQLYQNVHTQILFVLHKWPCYFLFLVSIKKNS